MHSVHYPWLRIAAALALLAGLAGSGLAIEPEISIHANNPTIAVGGHLEIELEYQTAGVPSDVYAVLFVPNGPFYSFIGGGQFGPPNTLLPLAQTVSGPKVELKLLSIEPLPAVPQGTYSLAAGLAHAGLAPLAPGALVVTDTSSFSIAGSGGGSGGGGNGGGSGGDDTWDDDGPEVEATARIQSIEPPAHFTLASGHRFQVYGLTSFEAPLRDFDDLEVGMLVEAEGHQQQDGDILAKKVKLED